MNSLSFNTTEKKATKAKLIEFMEQNEIEYNLIDCCECDRFCIEINSEKNSGKNHYCNSGIIVQTSNKDVCRVYPCEILYIAIEDRKSVLYLTNKKIETNYHLEYWKDILDPKAFAQPHHSFIVNLNYVDEVTNEFVKVKHGDKKYSVYTSSRKIRAFKKAFLDFSKR